MEIALNSFCFLGQVGSFKDECTLYVLLFWENKTRTKSDLMIIMIWLLWTHSRQTWSRSRSPFQLCFGQWHYPILVQWICTIVWRNLTTRRLHSLYFQYSNITVTQSSNRYNFCASLVRLGLERISTQDHPISMQILYCTYNIFYDNVNN